jgi:hypothetical protein
MTRAWMPYVLVLGQLGCSAHSRSASSANASRVQEDKIKGSAAIPMQMSAQGGMLTTLPSSAPLDFVGEEERIGSVSDIAIDGARLWAIDNNRGRLLVGTVVEGQTSVKMTEARSGRLTFPFALKATADRVYVSDEDGIHSIGKDGEDHTIRLFYTTADFAPTASSGFVLNPIVRGEGPRLASVDAVGRTVARWGRNPKDMLGQVRTRAFLASCGSVIAAAMTYDPVVYFLDPQLAEIGSVELPFPGLEELRSLASTPALANPQAGLYRLPTYTGGIACAGGRFFVVADLPRMVVFEVRPPGELRRVFSQDDSEPARHVLRLAACEVSGRVKLAALTEDPSGARRVVELLLPPENKTLSPHSGQH